MANGYKKNGYWYVSDISITRLPLEDYKVRAIWNFADGGSSTANYEVKVQYYTLVTRNGSISASYAWVTNGVQTTQNGKTKEIIIDVPREATKIRIAVKPVPGSGYKWYGAYSSYVTFTDFGDSFTPEAPPTPTITSNQTGDTASAKFTVLVDNLPYDSSAGSGTNVTADQVVFECIGRKPDGSTYVASTRTVNAVRSAASYTYTGTYGYSYRIRAKTKNSVKRYNSSTKKYTTKVYESEWSQYSSWFQLAPPRPNATNFKAVPLSESSVKLSWTKVTGADHYRIIYAANTTDYYNHSGTFHTEDTEFNASNITITGLDPGNKYYFNIRAINAEGAMSPYAFGSDNGKYLIVTLGAKPSAPSTWSSSTTCTIGENVNLYWVHNTEDESAERYAKITLKVNDATYTTTIANTNKDEYGNLIDKTRELSLTYNPTTGKYKLNDVEVPISDGDKVEWYVQTQGIKSDYSDPSVTRTIMFYEQPAFELIIEDVPFSDEYGIVIDSFPLKLTALVTENLAQKPIGMSLSIISTETYGTYDEDLGEESTVLEGSEVYGCYINTSTTTTDVTLTAGDVDFQNGVCYMANAVMSFDSGITAEASTEFLVAWSESDFVIDANVTYDPSTMSAQIVPICTGMEELYREYLVDRDGAYFCDSNGNILYDDMPISGPFDEETDYRESTPVEGVTLSVYRKDYNGRFVEIESGIENSGSHTCFDPHPTLDYARYRIVAKSDETGSMEYYDVPPYPIQDKRIIMQWDEEWITNYDEGDMPDSVIKWSGCVLKLPYNIDVSESNTVDSSLVEYVGRSRPVSYYGTQLGEKTTWNCDVPKYDTETLYLLRRLAAYSGDVYVREPSGLGYWANVTTSFSLEHTALVIPVSFTIKPVEGGV